ncbi:Trifunctional nucleotide phosphoesterase protein YfkN precursor [compost metagenome]
MNSKRRSFLKISSLLVGTSVLNNPLESAASITQKINAFDSRDVKVSIFHTNDLHGKIGASFKSFGGLKNVSHKLDEQASTGLLLDGGDFIAKDASFKERLDMISVMNKVGYHIAAPGKHELLAGEEELAKLIPYMQFNLVNCNYSFQNAELKKAVKPFVIIHSGKFKIGITGIGKPVKNIQYKDPFNAANEVAAHLKLNEKCDLVVCLSNLGYDKKSKTPDNKHLAESSKYIDLIISGNSLNSSSQQRIFKNKIANDVVLSQCVRNGLLLGKTEFYFNPEKQKQALDTAQLIPGQRADMNYACSFREVSSVKFA